MKKGPSPGPVPLERQESLNRPITELSFSTRFHHYPSLFRLSFFGSCKKERSRELGSTKTKKVNFTFIAATSVDLLQLVEKGEFRHDLYYRVAGATLNIPPLRDRREDIPLYLYHFLETINKAFNIHIKGFSNEARDILFHYDWPGNVRQLIHVLEQTAIHAWDVEEITSEHLPKELVLHEKRSFRDILPDADFGMKREIAQKEKNSIIAALKQTRGNKRQAAILLKMPRSTFYQKIRRYGIG